MNERCDKGGYKQCPVCGKVFYVIAPERWVYVHEGHLRGEDKKNFMCSWHCLRAHEKAYAERRDQAFKESRERARKKRAETLRSIKQDVMTRHCDECRYYSKDKYGFTLCSISGFGVSSVKMACRRFKLSDACIHKEKGENNEQVQV